MSTNTSASVLVAWVALSHGVSGSVRLVLSGTSEEVMAGALLPGREVTLRRESDDWTRILTVVSVKKQANVKGSWIARFQEIKDRTDADTLRGCGLFITESERPALPDGEYYVDELIGLDVCTDTGHPLGKLSQVLHAPGSDIYETDQGVLIPAVLAFGIQIDLKEQRMTVLDMPGLREGT